MFGIPALRETNLRRFSYSFWENCQNIFTNSQYPHSIKIFWQFSQNGWESLPKVTFPRATLCSMSVNKSPKEVNWFSKSYRVADLGSDFSILVLFHYLKLPLFQVPLKCNWTSSGKLHNKLLTEIMFLQWEWRDGSEENFTFSPSSCVIETLFILPFAFSGDFFFLKNSQ